MGRSLTFGQRLALGFTLVVLLGVVSSAVAVYALQVVVREKDRVIEMHGNTLIHAERLYTEASRAVAANRGFVISNDTSYLDERAEAHKRFGETIVALRELVETAEERQELDEIAQAFQAQAAAGTRIIELRKNNTPMEEIARQFSESIGPVHRRLAGLIAEFITTETRQRDDAKKEASERADRVGNVMIWLAVAGVVLAALVAIALSRGLSRQIGSAVHHIQSSSAELQAAANQQTAGSREQVAAMNEISTTIKELLATSRQITDSAQRVARIAEDTTGAARRGDQTVQRSQETVGAIRQQVDQIVSHMLDLGRKSQQIGGILDIINELAEQTNILSINATIEAAGAGEAGRRFSVVADEIRKLADRVGGSTKEIRGLIDEIRAAVNTTVMATESGSKAVDAGARQFGEVTAAFRQIVELLATTTEASREIELSTKQQTTAVEQVNIAVANVAQAARESETSSSQVLQTVTELTALSRDLSRLIQPQSGAA